jgi:hypothetical protein
VAGFAGGAGARRPTEPPAERPAATVDLRADGLADTVRHDGPPVPAGPVGAGEPGRP